MANAKTVESETKSNGIESALSGTMVSLIIDLAHAAGLLVGPMGGLSEKLAFALPDRVPSHADECDE
jgi:hypothetical protein